MAEPGSVADARDAGMRTALLVVVLGLVVAWFVMPRDEVAAGPSYGEMSAGAPVRLKIRALHVDAPVVPVEVSTDAVLDPPRDYREVGWWTGSAKPGAGTGQTVITGHTVHTGGGSMDHLRRLRPGQHVDVVTRRGTMRYAVRQVRVLSTGTVARRAARLFGQQGGEGRLVLVSCTDWNGSSYDSNVVVLGDPLGVPHKQPGKQPA
jgi:LPXTG-site transpeptidase (sortase) family protein